MTGKIKARVLVALESSHPTREVFEILVSLLNVETLELAGVYIEDEDLAQAAQLPGAMEVTLGGVLTQLDTESLRRDLEKHIRQMQDAFERLAREMQLAYSFQVARGRHVDELLRQATNADFVIISRPMRGTGLRPRQARQFAPLVAQGKNLLFVNEPWNSGRSVVVLCANGMGDESSTKDAAAIATAARLAKAESIDLVVATPGKHEPGSGTPGALAEMPATARVRRLAEWSETAIADLCLAENARLLVLPADTPVNLPDLLPRLVDRLPCSLLRLA